MISGRTAATAAALFASSVAAAQPTSETQALAEAAAGFYGVYMTLRPPDGVPDAAARARFAPFVSPALDRLFADGEAAEARYAKATKGLSPPLVEGDPFTPNFEGATSFKIGACARDPRGGHCAVTLTYDDRKDKPLVWTDIVRLVRTPSGWRVDDIVYGGNSGDGGRLTATLKSAIAEGDAFSR